MSCLPVKLREKCCFARAAISAQRVPSLLWAWVQPARSPQDASGAVLGGGCGRWRSQLWVPDGAVETAPRGLFLMRCYILVTLFSSSGSRIMLSCFCLL